MFPFRKILLQNSFLLILSGINLLLVTTCRKEEKVKLSGE